MYQILCLTISGFVLVAIYSFYDWEKPGLSYSASNGCICDKNREPVSACLDVCQPAN